MSCEWSEIFRKSYLEKNLRMAVSGFTWVTLQLEFRAQREQIYLIMLDSINDTLKEYSVTA